MAVVQVNGVKYDVIMALDKEIEVVVGDDGDLRTK